MSFKDWRFVPNGDDRRETATLLVGTAKEYGISPRDIRPVGAGFFVSPALEEVLRDESALDLPEGSEGDAEDSYDPADYKVDDVKEFVTQNPTLASDVLAAESEGKNRSTLVEWLTDFNDASSDSAAE